MVAYVEHQDVRSQMQGLGRCLSPDASTSAIGAAQATRIVGV